MTRRRIIVIAAAVTIGVLIGLPFVELDTAPKLRGNVGELGGPFVPPTRVSGGGGGGAGDITGVTAGAGVTGGASSGAASIDVGAGAGVTVNADDVAIDPTYTQRRVSGTCAAGSSIRVIAQDGTVTCETDDGGGGGAGDIESVTAGNGLTGGGTTGAVTLDIGAGTNITVNGDDVALSTNVDIAGTLDVTGNTSLDANIGVGTAANANEPMRFAAAVGNKIALYPVSSTQAFGFGVQSGLLQIYTSQSTQRVGLGYGDSDGFTETLSVRGASVGVGDTTPDFTMDVAGTLGVDGNATIGDSNTDTVTLTAKIITHVYYAGTAPTLSCGSNVTITGNDRRGTISFSGASGTAECQITFAGAFTTNAPVCVASANIINANFGVKNATTTVAVFHSDRNFTTGDVIYYHCDGWLAP